MESRPDWYPGTMLAAQLVTLGGPLLLTLGTAFGAISGFKRKARLRCSGSLFGLLIGWIGLLTLLLVAVRPDWRPSLEAILPWPWMIPYTQAPYVAFVVPFLLISVPFHAGWLDTLVKRPRGRKIEPARYLAWGLIELVLISPIGHFAAIISALLVWVLFIGLIPIALLCWLFFYGSWAIVRLMVGETLATRNILQESEPRPDAQTSS